MAVPLALLPELQRHLQEVQDFPSTHLDRKLFDNLEAQLPALMNDAKARSIVDGLVKQLSTILPTLQQDPGPVVSLTIRLIEPFSFSDVLEINPDFVAGLSLAAQPFNILTLTLLEKAGLRASDVAIMAGRPDIVRALVELWLCTPDTAIAQKCDFVLWGFLEVDYNRRSVSLGDEDDMTDGQSGRRGGQGLMWRRLFGDKDIYGILFSTCSLKSEGPLGKREKTVAQARLMDMIPRLANLDWAALQSQHPEVESMYGLQDKEGLLDFVALHMVDVDDDILMHWTLIDFFANLLKISPETASLSSSTGSLVAPKFSSPSLEFMISKGLHNRTSAYYLESGSPYPGHLSSRSSNYLSVYASYYADHLLRVPREGQTSIERIIHKISEELDISPGKWAHGAAPHHDLHLLASLPRVALLPQLMNGPSESVSSLWASSPVSRLPIRPANPDALHTLATIFHGPPSDSKDMLTYPLSSLTTQRRSQEMDLEYEAAAARALYIIYVTQNVRFWEHLISCAETVALKDNALAALTLLSAIITAKWRPLPTSPDVDRTTPYHLPTELQLSSLFPRLQTQCPTSGFLALLAPPALEHVLPYLLKPAQTFSNLVGGRGDTESTAYKVAVAKFDALLLLHKCFKEIPPESEGLSDVAAAVARRVEEGAWSVGADVDAYHHEYSKSLFEPYKMILPGRTIVPKIVSGIRSAKTQVQPCGVDLTLKRVSVWTSPGAVDFDNNRRLKPKTSELPFVTFPMVARMKAFVQEKMPGIPNPSEEDVRANTKSEAVYLATGSYLIGFNENVEVPLNLMGQIAVRSSLLHSGALLSAGVVDSGYKGVLEGLLQVMNPYGLRLYRDARLAQIIFNEMKEEAEPYDGEYKGAKKV
ncbi:MAG: hypothetical protein M1827_007229 [Pycnora praestabilis]|nr:MAG: hypothetical protein M1827_007229 [Pycnora praestabilis]